MGALLLSAAVDPMVAQRVRTASAARWRALDLEGRIALFTFARDGGDAPDVRARCPPVDRAALRVWYAAAWREVRSTRRGT